MSAHKVHGTMIEAPPLPFLVSPGLPAALVGMADWADPASKWARRMPPLALPEIVNAPRLGTPEQQWCRRQWPHRDRRGRWWWK